jgi:hypothetical protein
MDKLEYAREIYRLTKEKASSVGLGSADYRVRKEIFTEFPSIKKDAQDASFLFFKTNVKILNDIEYVNLEKPDRLYKSYTDDSVVEAKISNFYKEKSKIEQKIEHLPEAQLKAEWTKWLLSSQEKDLVQ